MEKMVFAVLDGVDPPGGRTSRRRAVRSTRKTVRCLGIAGPQEVAVQRVDLIVRVDRTHRRHQRLAGDMATEGALQKPRLRAEDAAAVDVDLELLEIEDLFDRHELFLPAALGQAMRLRDLFHVDADHRLAQPARHLRQHIGVVVEGGGLDDRGGAV